MARLDSAYIRELQEYLASGELEEDFKWSVEERRGEILEFLESVIELGETADAAATKIIFKGQLGALLGVPAESDSKKTD